MSNARVIAFYLPQFHPIPENDRWWSPGFTEWTNTAKAKPLFHGHFQPHLPADLGFYDLRVPETREAQAEMARQYGIEGFCYWHYWFGNGKRLLERPFDEVLESGKPDFPFCLAWANESWRGFYHGVKGKDVLITQEYPGEEDYKAHFNLVLKAFRDPRYIKVDGKPLFMIYQPFDNREQINHMMRVWRKLAAENGLPGIYFIAHTYFLSSDMNELKAMGFDAFNEVGLFRYKFEKPYHYMIATMRHNLFKVPYIVDYGRASATFLSRLCADENVFPTIIPNWDHSPRSGRNALVLQNSTPEKFRIHLQKVLCTIKDKAPEHRIAFIKSWNEWGEGNYLEPDLQYGRGYLEVLRDGLKKEEKTVRAP